MFEGVKSKLPKRKCAGEFGTHVDEDGNEYTGVNLTCPDDPAGKEYHIHGENKDEAYDKAVDEVLSEKGRKATIRTQD